MGIKKPESFTVSDWRDGSNTIGQMLTNNWRVINICRKCGLELRVNLEISSRTLGPGFSFWNRSTPCRRWNPSCTGLTDFWGSPPRLGRFIKLDAPWPGERY